MTLTDRIKEAAHELGFQLVGITPPCPPPGIAIYENWLAQGYHGEMAYLAREEARRRRAAPQEILPQCKSVIVLGIHYPPAKSDDHTVAGQQLVGRVASYAWGEDYHNVLAAKLRRLAEMIENESGQTILWRGYSDSGAVLERELAARTGLGWVGRNSCLLHPQYGSFFFIAELFVDLELETDEMALPDRCGSCRRCIEACPTHCILENRTIDARRCISYLTIELRRPIPPELRPKLGDWVFGCDICQQVCPWNERFASREGIEKRLAPRPGMPFLDLIEVLCLSEEAFRSRFADSPLRRAKWHGLLRNAVVVLGNLGDNAAVPILKRTLEEHPEALVRGHAAWALGHIGGVAARRALTTVTPKETDEYVSSEIERALEMGFRPAL